MRMYDLQSSWAALVPWGLVRLGLFSFKFSALVYVSVHACGCTRTAVSKQPKVSVPAREMCAVLKSASRLRLDTAPLEPTSPC